MDALTEREQILIALGAALAANCVPCVEKIVPKAEQIGLQKSVLEEAVRLADKVRRVPARRVLERTWELLGADASLACAAGDEPETCPLAAQGVAAAT